MMKRYLVILFIILVNLSSIGQKPIENCLEKAPEQIRNLLCKDELKTQFIISIEITELDVKSITELIDTFGVQNFRYIVNYSIGDYEGKIPFFKCDNMILVSEYEYLLFSSIESKTTSITNDQEILTREINNISNGMSSIKFMNYKFGQYNDEQFERSNINFQVTLELFDEIGFIHKIKSYIKIVNIESETLKNNEFRTLLCLSGGDMSQFIDGEIDLRIKRFRQLLFDPITGKLFSDAIVSPIVWLIED